MERETGRRGNEPARPAPIYFLQVDGFRKLHYSFCRPMILQAPLFRFTLWGLLSLWVFFGCLELAEQLHIVPEAAEEDQAHQDLDEEALIQLASGLKSDAARLSTHGCASAIVEMA